MNKVDTFLKRKLTWASKKITKRKDKVKFAAQYQKERKDNMLFESSVYLSGLPRTHTTKPPALSLKAATFSNITTN